MSITIRPQSFRQFGDPAGATFVLVTNRRLAEVLAIDATSPYAQHLTVCFDEGDDFQALLRERVPDRANILVVSPEAFFESPPTGSLGAGRRLLALACNSTPTGDADLAHFLEVAAAVDPADQERRTEQFFRLAEQAAWLVLRDGRGGTEARFDHLHDDYVWNQQCGFLFDGEQQLAPSGEISVLPKPIQSFDRDLHLALSGRLLLQGVPVLHGGRKPYRREDQLRVWQQLETLRHEGVIATVDRGRIVELQALGPAAEPARAALEGLFAEDERYRIVWEIGFAVHTGHRLLAGNHAMNETYGGDNGTIHIGLGLTPYTTYHLDLICPGTTVLDPNGGVVHGGTRLASRCQRNVSAGCGCADGGSRVP